MISRFPRTIDEASLSLSVGALTLFRYELLKSGSLTFFDSRSDIFFAFGAAGVGLFACFVAGRSAVHPIRAFGRLGLILAAVPLTLFACSRIPRIVSPQQWPAPVHSLENGLGWLSKNQALRWTTMLIAHAATSRRPELSGGKLPASWPVPAGVRHSLERRGDTIRIKTTDSTGTAFCSAEFVDGALMGHEISTDEVVCTKAVPATLNGFTPVSRMNRPGIVGGSVS